MRTLRGRNCAGLGRELIESELFGYITGAFTGADEDREGFFVAADGGTLFLDEIAEMPLDVQANLLRTVETDVVRPVGGTSKHSRKVDVRIIAATNQDLPRQNRRNLRKDLFFRLAVHQFGITPLRERKEDIPLLCEHILSGRAIISKEVEDLFMGYHWPGNVRELESVLEDALTRAGDGVLRKDRLSSDLKVRKKKRASPAHPIDKDNADYAAFTHQRRILDEEKGNITRAASRLDITRPTLRRRNKRWEGLGYPAIAQDVDSISDEDGGSS